MKRNAWKSCLSLLLAIGIIAGDSNIVMAAWNSSQELIIEGEVSAADVVESSDRSVTKNNEIDIINAGDIKIVTFSQEEETVEFKFIPQKTAVYCYFSEAEQGDPELTVYKEVGGVREKVASASDIQEDNLNFRLKMEFEAGAVYYLSNTTKRETASYQVQLLECRVKSEGVLIPNNKVTLQMDEKNLSHQYTFTPSQDGYYGLSTIGTMDKNVEVKLYQGESEIAESVWNSQGGFHLLSFLKAGVEYTYEFPGERGSCTFILQRWDASKQSTDTTYRFQETELPKVFGITIGEDGYYGFSAEDDSAAVLFLNENGLEVIPTASSDGYTVYQLQSGETYFAKVTGEQSFQYSIPSYLDYIEVYHYGDYTDYVKENGNADGFDLEYAPIDLYIYGKNTKYTEIVQQLKSKYNGPDGFIHVAGLYDFDVNYQEEDSVIGSGAKKLLVAIVTGDIWTQSVEITGESNVYLGEQITLSAKTITAVGLLPTIRGVSWSVSNTDIAEIDENGVLTGKREGKVIVTCQSRDGKASNTYEVSVEMIKAKEVKVSGASTVCEGKEIQLSATVTTETGKEPSIPGFVWGTSDASTVSVDETGLIRGRKDGKATITVSSRDGFAKDTIEITVKHDFSGWIVTEATCTSDGKRFRICSKCDTEEAEIIAKIPHNFTNWEIEKNATCVLEGTKVRTCLVGGEKEEETIEKLPHTPGSWTTTKQPTNTTEGMQEQRCSVCGTLLQTKPISKLQPSKIHLSSTVISSIKNQIYNGKAKTPSFKITYKGKTLQKDKDYSAVYRNNKNMGVASVVVTGKGDYEGSQTVSFHITPAKVTRPKAKSSSKKAVVSFKKLSKVSGYEIHYSTNKKFKSAKKLNSKKVKVTVKKLKSRKTYYFRVRAYKTVKGKKIYGPFSAAAKVKIK